MRFIRIMRVHQAIDILQAEVLLPPRSASSARAGAFGATGARAFGATGAGPFCATGTGPFGAAGAGTLGATGAGTFSATGTRALGAARARALVSAVISLFAVVIGQLIILPSGKGVSFHATIVVRLGRTRRRA